MLRPYITPGKDPVPILQEAGWAPGPVWTGGKSRPHQDSIPDRPARSQSLYQLSYPAHVCVCVCNVGGPKCKVYTNFSGTHHIDICSVQTVSHFIYFWNDISCLMLSLLLCLFCLHENRTWIQQKWMFLWLVDTLALLSSHWFPRQSQVLNLVRTSWKLWQKEYRQVSRVWLHQVLRKHGMLLFHIACWTLPDITTENSLVSFSATRIVYASMDNLWIADQTLLSINVCNTSDCWRTVYKMLHWIQLIFVSVLSDRNHWHWAGMNITLKYCCVWHRPKVCVWEREHLMRSFKLILLAF